MLKLNLLTPLHKRPPSIFLSKPNQFAEIVCERLCPNETANYLFNGLFPLVKKSAHSFQKYTWKRSTKPKKDNREIVQQSQFRSNFHFIPIWNTFLHNFTQSRRSGDPSSQVTAPAVNLTVRRGERLCYVTPPSELVDENNRRKTEKRLEPGCNERGERTKKKQNRDCRRRLRGVYDLFWKMVPQKAALKIQQHESYTNTEENNETRTHTTIIHTHIHKHTYVHTHTSANREEKGKRERAKRERWEGVAGLGEVTNNKYTHTQAKMWEKRLNENYFKLFRKRTERKLERGKNGKANAKQEMGSKGKGSERRRERVCSPLRAVAVLPECDDICGRRGGAGGKFRGQGKRLRQERNQFMKAYFLGARSVLL